MRASGSPMRFAQTPVRLERAGPLLGEHDDEVLAEAGLTPAEREALRAAGVTGSSGARGAEGRAGAARGAARAGGSGASQGR